MNLMAFAAGVVLAIACRILAGRPLNTRETVALLVGTFGLMLTIKALR